MRPDESELITRAGLTKPELARLLGIRTESIYKWHELPRNVRLLLEERVKRREAEEAFKYTIATLKSVAEE